MHEALIARAFQQAHDYKENTYKNLDMFESITDHIYQYGPDRRFKLFILSASSSYRSAIVRYRGTRYYVEHDYPTNTYSVRRM